MRELTEQLASPIEMARVARSAGLYNAARALWRRHPLLEDASDLVAAHFSSALPGRNDSLLADCLVDAITEYHRVDSGDGDKVGSYVVALLSRATDVFDLKVCATVPQGTVVWSALEEPLSSFCARYGSGWISVVRVTRDDLGELPGESLLLLGARLMPEFIGRYIVRHVLTRQPEDRKVVANGK